MNDIPEWVEAEDGSRIPRETVLSRMNGLGWTRERAERTPINSKLNAAGDEPVADRAGKEQVVPSAVQARMRNQGVSYEEARDHVVARQQKTS